MMTWRCPIITEMGMCPVTNIECPAHDPRCPHLPGRASDYAEVIVVDEGEKIYCPNCRGEHFTLRRVRLSDRMLASARLNVICVGCGYSESLYKIGDEK